MALYTFGGTPADVLTTATGDVVPDFPLLVRVAGTGQLVTALYEIDGVTPIGELRSNPATSPQPGAIRPFKCGVPAIEFEYNGPGGTPVRWYGAGRELAQEALAAALGSLSRADGGTVAGPLTAAGGLTVEDGLAVTGGATVDELAVTGDMTVGGLFAPASLSLAGMRLYNPRVVGAAGDGVQDDAPAVQAALDAAFAAGGGWVLVPPGTYRLATLPLRIRRNIRLTLMPGAVFVRAAAATLLLNGDADQTYGGYTGHGNITVEGGVWDMRGTAAGLTASAMCISIGHARNVTIRDLEVRDVPGFHGIELNSTKNALVDSCAFRGYIDPGGRTFSEAVQIDLAKAASVFGGFGPYDHTPCEDITIRGCYVGPSGTAGATAWPRGFGSHSATIDRWHKRIKVVGCTVEGGAQYAIGAYAWQDAVVESCTVTGQGAGVRLWTNDTTDANATTNAAGVQTGASQETKGATVTGNTFRDLTGYDEAIQVRGEPAGKLTGVTVTGNVIETVGGGQSGIRLEHAEQYTVTGNTIRGAGGTGISQEQVAGGVVSSNRVIGPGGSGISCDTGTGILIDGNTVRDAGVNGVHVLASAEVSVLNNIIRSPSRAAAGSYGIRVSSSADRITIAGNTVRPNGSGNEAAFGLSITSTCTNIRRFGNDLAGSGTTGPLGDDSTAPATTAQDRLSSLTGAGTTATAANTTVETALATFAIPGGDATAQAAYRFAAHGSASTTGTPNLTIRVRLGGISGTVLAAFAAITTSSGITGRGWRVEGTLHAVTAGASGTWAATAALTHHLTSTAGQGATEITDGTVTRDSTVQQNLVVTAQWSAAAASNTATAAAAHMQRVAA